MWIVFFNPKTLMPFLHTNCPHLLPHFEVRQGELVRLCRSASRSCSAPLVLPSQGRPQRQAQLGRALCRLRPSAIMRAHTCQVVVAIVETHYL